MSIFSHHRQKVSHKTLLWHFPRNPRPPPTLSKQPSYHTNNEQPVAALQLGPSLSRSTASYGGIRGEMKSWRETTVLKPPPNPQFLLAVLLSAAPALPAAPRGKGREIFNQHVNNQTDQLFFFLPPSAENQQPDVLTAFVTNVFVV